MDWHFVGVDLGQAKDFTAIAAVERAEQTGAWDPETYAWRKTASLRLRYQNLINLFLRDCAMQKRRPVIQWPEGAPKRAVGR